MHPRLKLQVYVVWFIFILSVGAANYVLPNYVTNFTTTHDCFTTEVNADYGFAHTGRPCPYPKMVSIMPLSTTKDPTIINSALYLATFPLYLFAILCVIGTSILWILLRLHPTKSLRP